MTTLHLSHTVQDFDRWLAVFESFADFRREGGVTEVTVRRGADDPNLVAIDLRFDSAEQARSFRTRLETEVWPNTDLLRDTPRALVLEPVGAG